MSSQKPAQGPSDFFWAAIICLVERGLVCGDIARHFKKSTTVLKDWHAHSLQLAAAVGLRASNVARTTLKDVHAALIRGPHCVEAIDTVPANICCCVENPTGMMEKQVYMQVIQSHHACSKSALHN